VSASRNRGDASRERGMRGTLTPNHSTGRDDHPLAFEVTSAERSRLGRPSSFLNGKERKQAFNIQRCLTQRGGLGDAALPNSSFKTTFALSHVHIFEHFYIPPRPPRAPFDMSSEALAKEEAPPRSGLGA